MHSYYYHEYDNKVNELERELKEMKEIGKKKFASIHAFQASSGIRGQIILKRIKKLRQELKDIQLLFYSNEIENDCQNSKTSNIMLKVNLSDFKMPYSSKIYNLEKYRVKYKFISNSNNLINISEY